MKTLFQMRQELAELGQELKKSTGELRTKAGDPSVKIEELRSIQEKNKILEERFNILKGEIEKEEKAQQEKIQTQMRQRDPLHGVSGEEQRMIAAKADFIRSALLRKPMAEESRAMLHAIPGDNVTGGEKFLPKNMTNDLVHEPFVTNPLRKVISMSNIKGLELPKIAYTIDDDSFITDLDTAKELELTGDVAQFGRHKFKVIARVSDTVLHGSDLDLVNYIENALRSGLAAKEKKVSFAATGPETEKHMSYYQAGIKEIEAEELFQSIVDAVDDLPEDYRENARIVMRRTDYTKILLSLANNSMALFQAPPEMVLGKPVEFCDLAATPVVGDFRFTRLNYDGPFLYDADKDVETGEYLFVLTAWFDQKHLLNSAFRLAKVTIPTP